MTDKRIQKLKLMIQKSRSRIIGIQPAFAETLRNTVYVAVDDIFRISANGNCIFFDPDWLQRLRDEELDFILAHQAMHILLGHIDRPMYYKGERFHLACDIIANSFLYSYGWEFESLSHIGTIYRKTFYPSEEGNTLTPEEAMKMVPFDPARERKRYIIDSDAWWDKKEDREENGVIILSPGEEDPFDMGEIFEGEISAKSKGHRKKEPEHYDFLSFGTDTEDKDYFEYSPLKTSWDKSSEKEIKALRDIRSEDQSYDEGSTRERWWKNIRKSKLDWRRLLNVFVREDLCDYSFTPPDRRSMDGDFFLPDFNVLGEKTKNILFMVDTSISVGDEILSVVYSELCSALYQFGDALEGVLAFFDTKVYRPIGFSSINDLKNIRPVGGGATDFNCIFEFVKNKMMNDPPLSIVVFTDGKGDFPPKEAAMNIPVLWMITNTHSIPEWGKCVVVEK